MKKIHLFSTTLILFSILTLISCDGLKDNVTVPIKIEPNPIDLSIKGPFEELNGEFILLEKSSGFDVKKGIEAEGYSTDNLKSLDLIDAKIKLKTVNPNMDKIDLFELEKLKLSFDNLDNPVAKVKKIDKDAGLIYLDILKSDVLTELEEGDVKIIISNDKPTSVDGELQLITELKAKVGLK